MAGKFSIVPSSVSRGDVVRGFDRDPGRTRAWLDTVRRRLAARFDFCPEGITHDLTVDLSTGRALDEGENAWSQRQNRETLTPYLARALGLLRRAGIDCTGVTSPWVFGIQVEPEYQAAIVAAQRQVNGRETSWYFLHMLADQPETRPWVALREGQARLVRRLVARPVILLHERERHLALLALGGIAGHPLARGPLGGAHLLASGPRGAGRDEESRRRAENGL
jgi:hypothetical protein